MSNKKKNLEKLTENAKEVIASSYSLAEKMGSSKVQLEHVFISLLGLEKGLAARFLHTLGLDLKKTAESIKKKISKGQKSGKIEVSDEVKELIKNAFLLAHEYKHVYVGTEHLLLAFFKSKKAGFIKELNSAGLNFDNVREKLFMYATYPPDVFVKDGKKKDEGPKAVDYFGRNLNKVAKAGKLMPIIGREKEIDRLIRILARHGKNNPILVGEAGVGKTAVVEGFVQRIVTGKVPASLKKLEVYQIDLTSIVAGSKVRGDVEQRLMALLSEVSSSPNKVLFIDEIHMIVGAGAAGSNSSMDIANILKPYLTDDNVRIIGATTLAEYRKYFDEDNALSRRFQSINIREISAKDALNILKGIKLRFEEYHGVKITNKALKAAVKLSKRYITDRFLPDKAIDVLDEACAEKKLKKEVGSEDYEKVKKELWTLKKAKDTAIKKEDFDEALDIRKKEDELKDIIDKAKKEKKETGKKGEFKVKEEDIKDVVAEWTDIPVTSMTSGEFKNLRGLQRRITNRIVGQKDAVKRVTAALKRARMGISDERRPLASFLFLGPTGVGKTELAKVIAKQFFGSEKYLFQVDMSEFMEQHSVAKIIGAPPGYVGYQEGGQLTEKVRKRPYSVVLFDEIEKAHPELLSILLQILEEGHITDSKGRKVNFKNTIVILTSNIGAKDIIKDQVLGFKTGSSSKEKNMDKAYQKMREQLLDDLKKELRPEFLNRIDDVIIFRALNTNDAEKIAKLLIKDLDKRLEDKKIDLEVTDKSLEFIAKKGFSKEYGARNIRRTIQEYVENPLSDLLLENDGNLDDVVVKKDNDELKLISED